MPSRACRFPLCTQYTSTGQYCDEHRQAEGKPQSRHSYYNQHLRNKEAQTFYASAGWKLARSIALRQNPVCQRCNIEFATTVHHVVPVTEATREEKLQQKYLIPLCQSCHSLTEAEIKQHGG